jgi:hypothetical protein
MRKGFAQEGASCVSKAETPIPNPASHRGIHRHCCADLYHREPGISYGIYKARKIQDQLFRLAIPFSRKTRNRIVIRITMWVAQLAQANCMRSTGNTIQQYYFITHAFLDQTIFTPETPTSLSLLARVLSVMGAVAIITFPYGFINIFL